MNYYLLQLLLIRVLLGIELLITRGVIGQCPIIYTLLPFPIFF